MCILEIKCMTIELTIYLVHSRYQMHGRIDNLFQKKDKKKCFFFFFLDDIDALNLNRLVGVMAAI